MVKWHSIGSFTAVVEVYHVAGGHPERQSHTWTKYRFSIKYTYHMAGGQQTHTCTTIACKIELPLQQHIYITLQIYIPGSSHVDHFTLPLKNQKQLCMQALYVYAWEDDQSITVALYGNKWLDRQAITSWVNNHDNLRHLDWRMAPVARL